MRRTLEATVFATFLLASGSSFASAQESASAQEEDRKLFLVYSADERNELHPCG
jgi:hypothetical protein